MLSRVKSFLPQLEESNRVLQERLASEPAENLDIEHLVDYDGPVIEMVMRFFIIQAVNNNYTNLILMLR